MPTRARERGITLIETLVFIVVVTVALVAVLKVFNQSISASVDPLVRVRALELAQAQLDEILARKFDENTPSGGVPACDSAGAPACAGIVADSDYDDVGDFNGYSDSSYSGYTVNVIVSSAGADLGLAANLARRIQVNVSMPDGDQLTLSAYKVNF